MNITYEMQYFTALQIFVHESLKTLRPNLAWTVGGGRGGGRGWGVHAFFTKIEESCV